ncbi:MAG: endo-1,4-beta-xylanase [Paludibacteraceae bacterium]|nr:endo-1,4-beta-xylanase [Paludibacteraceae bacterium]
MVRFFRFSMLVIGLFCVNFSINAQLAKDNKCKFLGNITTSYNWQEQADAQGVDEKYYQLWNQITSENGSKWGSIHKGWGKFDWSNSDRAYNYAKQHGFPFKFHCLIWGSQYPSWIESLSAADTYKAIEEWMDAVKEHYPDLELIDVVNEAIYAGGKYHSSYEKTKIIEALGGTGKTGYDWIIKAFHMARERWPNAKLIYNDYNTFRWQKNEFIALVKALIDGGAPIDAYGAQSHDLTDMEFDEFKRAMDETQQKLKIPMYITEYDIGTDDDNLQLQRYKEQIPYMWEADYVAGVTLWGWIYGKTWTTNGNSGIIKNGQDRPAMKWLREYMATDAAKNAKGPFCGAGNKITADFELSVSTAVVGDEVKISVSASVKEGSVDHVDMFIGDSLLVNKYVAPYEWSFAPANPGSFTIKIVVYDKGGNTLEKTAKLTVCDERKPYSGSAIELPGTLELEDFDRGCNGLAYSDSDDENEGDGEYRKESGADVVKGNGGLAIGYTSAGEWMEYTVNVKSAGNYSFVADVASGSDNSGFHISLMNGGEEIELTDKLDVPNGGDWDTYTSVEGELSKSLEEGEQILRVTIDGPYVNIDKIVFTCTDCKEETTSVESIYADEIVISPNPAKNFVEVKSVDFEYAEIIDLAGKIVKKSDEKIINISNIPIGSYIIKVYSINNPVISRIFVKMD